MSSTTRAIGLVARRELTERSRSKGFRISVVLVLLGAVGLTIAPKFIDPTSSTEVGVVGTPPAGFGQVLQSTAADDEELTVSSYPDQASGEQAVRDGDVDVLWVPDAGQLVWEKDEQATLAAQVRAAVTQVQFDATASQLGLTAQQQQQLQTPPQLTPVFLDPAADDEGARYALAFGSTVVLFVAISMFGGFVMTSVVTEKTSRIAEVLLSQVRASELLAGKILGIGSLALAELVAVGAAVLIAGRLADTITLPGAGVTEVVVAVGFFVLGFAIYATLYGAAGALVDRQEDAQAVAYPIMIPLLGGYLGALSSVGSPDNAFNVALSLFPLTAPVAMPLRIVLGDVPAWQVGLSVVLCLAFIWATILFGGRVYAGGLLRTGSRVKVREALRAAPG